MSSLSGAWYRLGRSLKHLIETVAALHSRGMGFKSLTEQIDEAGFVDFETSTVRRTFVLPSFDAYYAPFERGGASTGQLLTALPEAAPPGVSCVTPDVKEGA